MIFGDFGGPQGGPKITKNRKKAFQKSIEKKDAKKEAMTPVEGEGRRPLRGPGNPKIPLRKALASTEQKLKYASIPCGVRRMTESALSA